MIRLSRLTDYGIVVMSQMAMDATAVRTAPDLARASGLPAPTVSKLLKLLGRAGLVESRRGVHGGYALARPLAQITAAEMIEALDGPVALTACVEGSDSNCNVESLCPMRGGWDKINTAIRHALEEVSLAELCAPMTFPAPSQLDATAAAQG